MPAQPADLYEILKKIRYDATAIQAKVTDALNVLAALNLPDQPTAPCPRCGLELAGPRSLAEHMFNSHGGPVPPHYDHVEAISDQAADEPAL